MLVLLLDEPACSLEKYLTNPAHKHVYRPDKVDSKPDLTGKYDKTSRKRRELWMNEDKHTNFEPEFGICWRIYLAECFGCLFFLVWSLRRIKLCAVDWIHNASHGAGNCWLILRNTRVNLDCWRSRGYGQVIYYGSNVKCALCCQRKH